MTGSEGVRGSMFLDRGVLDFDIYEKIESAAKIMEVYTRDIPSQQEIFMKKEPSSQNSEALSTETEQSSGASQHSTGEVRMRDESGQDEEVKADGGPR